MTAPDCFHILTGEYPPQLGGVSDYTGHLAEGLARCGKEVHAWTIPCVEPTTCNKGVTVHRIAGNWLREDLQRLDQALAHFPGPRLLLVQYVFNAFGSRGLNFGIGRWLLERRRKGDDVRLMVHEPFYPWKVGDKLARWVLSKLQRHMLRTLLKACTKVYVSIPRWEEVLRPYQPKPPRPVVWLPIPSNIPVVSNQPELARVRQRLALEEKKVIGTFSIYAEGKELARLLPNLLLPYRDRVALLLGRNSESFAAALTATYPQLKDRLVVSGLIPAEQVSLHLQACDLLVQPYADGVSSRRTSVMAGLAHGKPVVTNIGTATEAIWSETNCVAMTEIENLQGMAQLVESLLTDSTARQRLEARAVSTYDEHFEWKRVLTTLLA